jgi:hypothetical protein
VKQSPRDERACNLLVTVPGRSIQGIDARPLRFPGDTTQRSSAVPCSAVIFLHRYRLSFTR